MPTLDEWEQALTTPRTVIVESSQALVQEVQQIHAAKDAKRVQDGDPIPPRKNNLAPVATFAPELQVPVVPAYLLERLGVVTTPLIPNLADLCSTWARLRYLWAFEIPNPGAQAPRLKLSAEARNIDFHQKGLLSDEIGIGMAALLLGTYFNAPESVDVSIAMDDGNWQIGQLNRSSPDYLFFDSTKANLFVVECKGTQTSRSNSLDQVRRGTEQVQSLVFTNRPTPPSLVVATCISKTGTRILLIDPPGDEDGEKSKERPERINDREWMIRDTVEFDRSTRLFSESKLLSFAGADEAAENKLEQTRIMRPTTRRYQRREFEITENEFGRFRGVRQRIGLGDRMNVDVFQALDVSIYDALLVDDPAQIDEETRTFQRRSRARTATPGVAQPVSTTREDGGLIVRTAGPDGSLLEIRVSQP